MNLSLNFDDLFNSSRFKKAFKSLVRSSSFAVMFIKGDELGFVYRFRYKGREIEEKRNSMCGGPKIRSKVNWLVEC